LGGLLLLVEEVEEVEVAGVAGVVWELVVEQIRPERREIGQKS